VSAVEGAFREEAPRLWRALMAFTAGRPAIAEDAVAEAFSRALSQSDRIRDPIPWVYRVAFRIAAEELKREGTIVGEPPEQAVGSVSDREGLAELYGALAQLPPNQRAAVFLHYQCDLSVTEVASRLGVARATARVHLWRGRSRLRTLLEGGADE
jgi:RNA polymerase sigma-70 factor (ECF subfamily)